MQLQQREPKRYPNSQYAIKRITSSSRSLRAGDMPFRQTLVATNIEFLWVLSCGNAARIWRHQNRPQPASNPKAAPRCWTAIGRCHCRRRPAARGSSFTLCVLESPKPSGKIQQPWQNWSCCLEALSSIYSTWYQYVRSTSGWLQQCKQELPTSKSTNLERTKGQSELCKVACVALAQLDQ